MDRNEITRMASVLLNQFGHYVDPNPGYCTIELYDEYYELEAYGLRIKRMHKTGEIIIEYDNKKVFDINMNITGGWQEVLKEYYNKIPAILEKEAKEKAKLSRCDEISKTLKCFVKGMNTLRTPQETVMPTSDILIDTYSTKNDYHHDITVTSVYYNNEEVFNRVYQERYGNNDWPDAYITYPVYVEGEWEHKLEDAKADYAEEAAKVRHMNNLNELRNLKS